MKYLIKATVILIAITFFAPTALAEQTEEERLEGLCTEGNSTACFKMGERYRVVERDKKTAVVFLDSNCVSLGRDVVNLRVVCPGTWC